MKKKQLGRFIKVNKTIIIKTIQMSKSSLK